MAKFILGMDAKIYQGPAGTTATLEMSNVRDVTLNMEAGEADVTTRANKGWRATAPTLKEGTCEFDMVWNDEDVGFTAIKNAFLNNTLIALKVLTKENGQGPDADFAITSFSRNEALEEAISVAVTAKISEFRAWVGGTP
jgi:predicted secreted protein